MPPPIVYYNGGTPESGSPWYPYQVYAFRVVRELFSCQGALLVASPTGSGKTAVIEKACEEACGTGSRLIIAEPLVALAEEMRERLKKSCNGSIGLLTGPIRKGEDEDIRVCTYEIASSILSECNEAEAGPVIVIDEFHNIADSERGNAVKEIVDRVASLKCSLIALSGTLPNTEAVAKYIGLSLGVGVRVTGAESRPVPLVWHMLTVTPTDVKISEVQRGCSAEARALSINKARAESIGGIRTEDEIIRVCRKLRDDDLLPAMAISFSCARVEYFASSVARCEDFSDKSGRSRVTVAFDGVVKNLPDSQDAVLFDDLRRWALRGIGAHHSRQPPQYLSLLGNLVRCGAVRLIFCTSSLSAGLNMPVRSVLLTQGTMPSEEGMVPVPSGLMHQMFGRAGRPGLEKIGHAISCVEVGKSELANGFISREPEPVIGKLRLTEGDVLRCRRRGKSILLEHNIICGFDMRRGALMALTNKYCAERILECRKTNTEKCALQALSIASRMNTSLAPFATVGWDTEISYDAVNRTIASSKGNIPLIPRSSKIKKRLKIPFELLEQKCEYDGDAKKLISILPQCEGHLEKGSDVLRAWNVIASADDDDFFSDSMFFFENKELAKRLECLGAIDNLGAITFIGAAASRVRACEASATLLFLLLATSSPAEMLDIISFMSLAERSLVADASRATARGAERALKSIQAADTVSEPIRIWVKDKPSMASLCSTTGKKPGELCRNIVRVHDCTVQASEAVSGVGVNDVATKLQDLASTMRRGLPFYR